VCRLRLLLFFLSLFFFGQAGTAEEREVDPGIQFQTVDLYMNSGKRELAAYQVEIYYPAETVKIVGVEGGDKQAFQTPPTYDERGFEGGRIILAAFTEEDTCPKGRTRVARIHLALESVEEADIQGELMAAAEKGGKRFSPRIELRTVPRGGDSEE